MWLYAISHNWFDFVRPKNQGVKKNPCKNTFFFFNLLKIKGKYFRMSER